MIHPSNAPVLQIRNLHGYYGQSHALQGVHLTLESGAYGIVGRNGMGKTTLCHAIMGLLPKRQGSIRFMNHEILSSSAYRIASKGIGYVPQGRRLWPSLGVEEHLQLFSKPQAAWTMDRVYTTFPRLYERRKSSAKQLSGGEQQMLAIARALLQSPMLLILDEPTEGLAPVIVNQLQALLKSLVQDEHITILLIEQNIALAASVSDQVAVMINGKIDCVMPSAQLAGDIELQKRLLGVGRTSESLNTSQTSLPTVDSDPSPDLVNNAPKTFQDIFISSTLWTKGSREASKIQASQPPPTSHLTTVPLKPLYPSHQNDLQPLLFNPSIGSHVYVVGTFDTKGKELFYLRDCLRRQKITATTVDLSTSHYPSIADVPPHMVAGFHPQGTSAVFTDERGSSIEAMAKAFQNWLMHKNSVGGILSAGGSGGTALVAPAMQVLPVGIPKLMISTVASGNVRSYVGASDMMMMNSVTDVQGLNRISRKVLKNGANAIAGMVRELSENTNTENDKPSLGLTMFGVTTKAIQQITKKLEPDYDCLVFHATGIGGQAMEKLVDSGMLKAVIDLTTTELCDMIVGGVFPATADRFGAFIRHSIPYIGSVGALDMVNFHARDTIPKRFQARCLVQHNPQVTLMRTNKEEVVKIGQWLCERLNLMRGPVRFLIPEAGVSALDAPGQPFYDPDTNMALFNTIKSHFKTTALHHLVMVPDHINEPGFTHAVIRAFEELVPKERKMKHVKSF